MPLNSSDCDHLPRQTLPGRVRQVRLGHLHLESSRLRVANNGQDFLDGGVPNQVAQDAHGFIEVHAELKRIKFWASSSILNCMTSHQVREFGGDKAEASLSAIFLGNAATHVLWVQPDCLLLCLSCLFQFLQGPVRLHIEPGCLRPRHCLGFRHLLLGHLLDGRLSSRLAVVLVDIDDSIILRWSRA